MILKRQNVLDLIGSDRRKYHSCLLTCYSFDFLFFEERVLPILRSANIKNINVLTDGKLLEETLEHTTGKEFKQHKTYSIHPIYSTGVFHPKILLLTGVKHGLLIIGSGNLTSSGISSNDEIWGAFHLDTTENENAPLFGKIWHYLLQFTEQVKGFNIQKIDWIKIYSPWIAEVAALAENEVKLVNHKSTVYFVNSKPKESIFQQIVKQVPSNNKLVTITIVSPFFDKDGGLLNELIAHFKPKYFNCLVDEVDGILPTEIKRSLKDKISFFKWSDCKNDSNDDFNRLHAKLFHFEFSNGLEYLLLGSANATQAAWGSKNEKSINEEAEILLKRESESNYLIELGIKIPKTKEIDITGFPESKRKNTESSDRKSRKVKITYAQLEGSKITAFVLGEIPKGASAIILSKDTELVESHFLDNDDEEIEITCQYPEDAFKIFIEDSKGKRVSNFALIHQVEFQAKCNPDPEQEKLNSLLDAENYVDNEGLSELVAFVDYNWADEDDDPTLSNASGFGSKGKNQTQPSQKKYEVLSPKEFNKISQEVILKQTGELNSTNVKIAEFLHIIGHNLAEGIKEQFEESEELKLLEDREQRGEGSESYKRKRTIPSAAKEIRSITQYFKKLNDQLSNQLEKLMEAKSLTAAPDRKLTIKNLSNIMIALSLVHLYYGKKYYEEDGGQYGKNYLEEGDIYADVGSVKSFMIEVVGRFLLLSTAGFKTYDYDLLNNKVSDLRNNLFHKCVFLILNLSWNNKEIDYRDNLLLNALYFLLPNQKVVLGQVFRKNLQRELSKLESSAKRIGRSYDSNKHDFFGNIIPTYIDWFSLFEDKEERDRVILDTTHLSSSAVIFNSKVGFNVVQKYSKSGQLNSLVLKRAGFEWSDENEEYLLENIAFPSKCIIYKK